MIEESGARGKRASRYPQCVQTSNSRATAKQGFTYDQILKAYYTGIELTRMY
jgi:hypothetical protein